MTENTSASLSAERTSLDLDPSHKIRVGIQWLLFLRVLVVSLLLGLSLLLQTKNHELVMPPFQYLAYFIAGVYGISIGSALMLKVVNHVERFAFSQILVDVFLITCLVYFTGCGQSIFTIIYFFPIIAGSLILYRKGGLFFAALNSLSFAGILVLEGSGLFPKFFFSFGFMPIKEPKVLLNLFSIYGLSFVLVAILSSWLSERLRKTEAKLSQTTESYDRLAVLYKQIFDDISTGIITVDSSGEITSFNNAAKEITGYAAHEMIGRLLSSRFPQINLRETFNSRSEAELIRKDGTKIPTGFSTARLHNPAGQQGGCVITIQDLSRIKMMEAQVRQSEKLAAIGEMAAGIAHEFRNPLAAISGAAQVFYKEFGNDPTCHGLMRIIIRECDRLDSSISEFLQYSKPSTPEKILFPLHRLFEEVVELLEKSHGHIEHRIIANFSKNADCWGDFGQLKQVFINIMTNSLHAMEGRRDGVIRVGAEEITEGGNRERIILTLSDNGPGIPEHIMDKIFHPFFTTRENGTGLGLAIVHQLVKSHEGEIQVKSKGNGGTTFVISLPLP